MKRPATSLSFLTCAILAIAAATSAGAQNIIPQIADGGGWQTTLVVANTSASSANTNISFFQQSQSDNTTSPWNLAFQEASFSQNLTIAPGDVRVFHSLGTSATLTVGWAKITGDPNISVYAVFTQHVIGRPDQDSTVLASAPAPRVLVPYDNTSGFTTAMAIVNAGATSQTITVGLDNSKTGVVQSSIPSIVLPAGGHIQFNTGDQFAATGNSSGIAEFTTSGGSISVVAIRFNSSGSFTSAPAFDETGAGIIPITSPGTPSFSQLNMSGSASNTTFTILVTNPGNGAPMVGTLSGKTSGANPTSFTAVWDNVTLNGLTLTFNSFDSGKSGGFTSGTLTITLSNVFLLFGGPINGSINLVGSPNVSGNFSGSGTPF